MKRDRYPAINQLIGILVKKCYLLSMMFIKCVGKHSRRSAVHLRYREINRNVFVDISKSRKLIADKFKSLTRLETSWNFFYQNIVSSACSNVFLRETHCSAWLQALNLYRKSLQRVSQNVWENMVYQKNIKCGQILSRLYNLYVFSCNFT